MVQGLAKRITLKSPTKSPEADPPDTLEENIGAAALELTPADLAQNRRQSTDSPLRAKGFHSDVASS